MGYFRRFTSGVVARIDELALQVENHESLADAALQQLQAATARAQARQAVVRRDGEALRSALGKERDATGQWKERALRLGNDEVRALECLRRSKRAQQKALELETRCADHARAERELAKDVLLLVERLGSAREQRNLMRTRQTRAEALASVQGNGLALGGELAAVFQRWEEQVMQTELAGGCRVDAQDDLEHELLGEEEQSTLRAELAALRSATGQGGEHV